MWSFPDIPAFQSSRRTMMNAQMTLSSILDFGNFVLFVASFCLRFLNFEYNFLQIIKPTTVLKIIKLLQFFGKERLHQS
jgi:hypothetical protein